MNSLSMKTNVRHRRVRLMSAFFLFSFIALLGHGLRAGDFELTVDAFVDQHCIKCHDARKEKGDFRIDELSRDLTDPANAIAWQDALDLVAIGEMPPEGQRQPSAGELKSFVKAVEGEIRRCAELATGDELVHLRRLSRSAMDNTVADLLGTRLRLSTGLPQDSEVAGFDNMAETLTQSGEFMRVYQQNARKIAQDVIDNGPDPRVSITQTADQLERGKAVETDGDTLVLWCSKNRGHVVWPSGFSATRPGVYRVTLEMAQSINTVQLENQVTSWGKKNTMRRDQSKRRVPSRPLPPGRRRHVSLLAATYPLESVGGAAVGGRQLAQVEVGQEMSVLDVEVELEAGETFFVHASDCSRGVRSPWGQVAGETKLVGELLRVKQIQVQGPLVKAWPNPITSLLIDQDQNLTRSGLQQLLRRGFRRPVSPETLALYGRMYSFMQSEGMSAIESTQQLVESMLCSPRFMYESPFAAADDAHALASRLSYFLWNSMPDDELTSLASTGELLDKPVLREQVRRMLANPKSERFVIDFTGQWLGLRHVGDMLPDPKLYPDYDPALELAMRQESESLFSEILHKNLPVTDFLDPGYAMLNERLAEHYEIEGVHGNQFRRVELPASHPRGGLLGHASMLTTTSNGTRTSPVVRGVWILENLFDSPPSPPPPDVEPIEPDVRGATTIREMLAKHRDVATCNECHRRIDPWGFGLENFNAVGAWRTHYGRNGEGKSVDASGKTPRGEAFDGVVEMRSTVMTYVDRFTHALTAKLLAHAVGHPTTVKERIEIERIVDRNRDSGGRFADLITEICTSPAFAGE